MKQKLTLQGSRFDRRSTNTQHWDIYHTNNTGIFETTIDRGKRLHIEDFIFLIWHFLERKGIIWVIESQYSVLYRHLVNKKVKQKKKKHSIYSLIEKPCHSWVFRKKSQQCRRQTRHRPRAYARASAAPRREVTPAAIIRTRLSNLMRRRTTYAVVIWRRSFQAVATRTRHPFRSAWAKSIEGWFVLFVHTGNYCCNMVVGFKRKLIYLVIYRIYTDKSGNNYVLYITYKVGIFK